MKVAIFGSRTLTREADSEFIEKEIKAFLETNKVDYFLIPGGIEGVCDQALKIVSKMIIPVILYFYDRSIASKWGRIRSITERTKKIITEADYFLFFHDGESKGTIWDLKQVKKAKKLYSFFEIQRDEEDMLAIIE